MIRVIALVAAIGFSTLFWGITPANCTREDPALYRPYWNQMELSEPPVWEDYTGEFCDELGPEMERLFSEEDLSLFSEE